MANSTCNSCGNKITGLKYTYEGKSYCQSCYQIIQQELLKTEQEKDDLYNYIKQLFGISEVPGDLISGIDRELFNGKKINGIKQTLKYYYQTTGHPCNNIGSVIYVIRDQYENARNYLINTIKIVEQNKIVNLDVPARTIQIKKSELDAQDKIKKKINYNIEDL